MKPILADASAILAYLLSEPGSQIIENRLGEVEISAVNLAEIVTVLTGRDVKKEWIERRVLQVFSRIVPFDRAQAALAGYLAEQTRTLGLSLGDRACLAAGIIANAQVLTADSAWKDLDLSIDIVLLR